MIETGESPPNPIDARRPHALVFCPVCGALVDPPLGAEPAVPCHVCDNKVPSKEFEAVQVVTRSSPSSFPHRPRLPPDSSLTNHDAAGAPTEIPETARSNAHLRDGATIKEKCPKCDAPEMVFHTAQLRSADEGQTIFYNCIKCGSPHQQQQPQQPPPPAASSSSDNHNQDTHNQDTHNQDTHQQRQIATPAEPSPPSSRPSHAKRLKIAQELLETERRYLDCLVILDDLFYAPLIAACGSPAEIVPRKQINDIFSNLKDIRGVNMELLTQLQSRIEGAPFNPNKTCIGDIFLVLAPYLKMYSLYAKNFNHAIVVVAELTQRVPAFAAFARQQALRPECRGRILQTFLIEPVQRIPRYKLLLENLFKHTPEKHPDYAKISKALGLVSEVANFVNEEIRQHENVLKVIDIQKGLIGLHESLLAPGRRFIYRGHVQKISRKSTQPRELILFSDILVYASPAILEDQFLFHRKLHLEHCHIEDVPDNDFVKNQFQIVTRDKSFAVYADTPTRKQYWITTLNTTISECIEARKTLKTGRGGAGGVNGGTANGGNREYQAPVWVPDSLGERCRVCGEEFTFFNRKHHCRSCGNIVCAPCSKNSFYLPLTEQRQLGRACDTCIVEIVQQNRFEVLQPVMIRQERVALANTRDVSTRSSSLFRHSGSFGVVGDAAFGLPWAADAVLNAAAHVRTSLHLDRPTECSLCVQPFTLSRRMVKCTACDRIVCTECISRNGGNKCDPCSRGVRPEDVVVNTQIGGWSVVISEETD